jgi:hypothetical protein
VPDRANEVLAAAHPKPKTPVAVNGIECGLVLSFPPCRDPAAGLAAGIGAVSVHTRCAVARAPADQGAVRQERVAGWAALGRDLLKGPVWPLCRTHVLHICLSAVISSCGIGPAGGWR